MPADDVATLASRLLRETECQRPKCKCRAAARRGQGLTHCVVHEDPNPSLNITIRSGKLLVYCHACADSTQIVEALKAAGYWPEQAEYGAKQIVAEYDYTDADGKLLYQVLRYANKDFKQRRPRGKDWVWSLGDVALVPYRLPELLADPNRIVFVVEGEKDVERLMAEGLLATCNSGGAGKWYEVHSSYFRGRRVYLIPDNDEAGRSHMRMVARSLEQAGAVVSWLELPEVEAKGDVSEWLDAGHTIDELKVLTSSAGHAPAEAKRERVFRREGVDYRIDVAEAPVVMRFGRIKDHSDSTMAEVWVTRANDRGVLVRRSVNLLAASNASRPFTELCKDLSKEELGPGEDSWKRILAREFEAVLDAHRNGVVTQWTEGEIERPADPLWLCEGLVLHHKLNAWLGAGSTGKSTLAKIFATYYAAGFRFLGRETMQGVPLYLDYEDDKEDFDRVAYDTARNLGFSALPKMGWMRMRGKRLRDCIPVLTREIAENGVTLLIIDAIAPATGSSGERRSYDDMAVELEEALGQLPPVSVLALDHISAQDHRDTKSVVPTKARGAERKFEIWRNQYTLIADEDERERGRHVVTWYHTKINRGMRRPKFTCEVVYREREIAVNEIGIAESSETVERMKPSERTLFELRQSPGLKAIDYARLVRGGDGKNAVESTRSELKRHAERGDARIDRDANWWPMGAWAVPEPRQLGVDKEDEPATEPLPYWND